MVNPKCQAKVQLLKFVLVLKLQIKDAITEVCVGLLERSVFIETKFVKEMRPRFQRQAEKT